MSRLTTSFVLGYHGCDRDLAVRAVNGEVNILQSDRGFDWLGPGAYFWEGDPRRAQEWADWKVSRGAYKVAAVVGAVIDLRHCLDLQNRDDLEVFKNAHRSFVQLQRAAGVPLPENKSAPGQPNQDMVLRFLDCAVFKHLHSVLDQPGPTRIPPYDTVRGLFVEGDPAFGGSGIRNRNHIQIAVRNSACILGIFFPTNSY